MYNNCIFVFVYNHVVIFFPDCPLHVTPRISQECHQPIVHTQITVQKFHIPTPGGVATCPHLISTEKPATVAHHTPRPPTAQTTQNRSYCDLSGLNPSAPPLSRTSWSDNGTASFSDMFLKGLRFS